MGFDGACAQAISRFVLKEALGGLQGFQTRDRGSEKIYPLTFGCPCPPFKRLTSARYRCVSARTSRRSPLNCSTIFNNRSINSRAFSWERSWNVSVRSASRGRLERLKRGPYLQETPFFLGWRDFGCSYKIRLVRSRTSAKVFFSSKKTAQKNDSRSNFFPLPFWASGRAGPIPGFAGHRPVYRSTPGLFVADPVAPPRNYLISTAAPNRSTCAHTALAQPSGFSGNTVPVRPLPQTFIWRRIQPIYLVPCNCFTIARLKLWQSCW